MRSTSRRPERPGSPSSSGVAPCRLNDENSRGKVQNVLCQEERASFGAPCCTRDEGRSFGAGFQEQASNNRKLLRPNGRGGERYGKGVTRSRHVGSRETNASEPSGRGLEMHTDDIKTGEATFSPGRAWRRPGYRPCDVRGRGGVTLVLALVRNLRTCSVVPREKAQAEDPRGRKYRNTEQGRTAP